MITRAFPRRSALMITRAFPRRSALMITRADDVTRNMNSTAAVR